MSGDPPSELVEFIDLQISFLVTALDPSHPIKDNSLGLSGEVLNELLDVGMFVREDVQRLDDLLLGTNTAEYSYLQSIGWVDDRFNQIEFDPQQSLRVTKNMIVNASVDGEVANLVSVTQRFSQVPEPATLLLMGLGLFSGLTIRSRKNH